MEDSALKMPLQNDGARDWKRNRNYMEVMIHASLMSALLSEALQKHDFSFFLQLTKSGKLLQSN